MRSLAYLLSQYPAINHPFMLREVRRLRELGFEIQVASIRPPDRPFDKLTPVERDEARSTFYIKTSGLGGLLRAHLATLFARPQASVGGLSRALGPGPPASFYSAKGVVPGVGMMPPRFPHAHIPTF